MLAALILVGLQDSYVGRFHEAWSAYERGDFESAEKLYESALELRPGSPVALEHLRRVKSRTPSSEPGAFPPSDGERTFRVDIDWGEMEPANDREPLIAVRAMASARDADRAAVVLANGQLHLLDLASAQTTRVEGRFELRSVAYDDPATTLALVDVDGTVSVASADGRERRRLGVFDGTNAVHFDRNARHLLVQSDSRAWRIWRIADGEVEVEVSDRRLVDFDWSLDGTYFSAITRVGHVACIDLRDNDDRVEVWSLATGQHVSFDLEKRIGCGLEFSPRSSELAATAATDIFVLDPADGRQVWASSSFDHRIWDQALGPPEWSPDGTWIFTVDGDWSSPRSVLRWKAGGGPPEQVDERRRPARPVARTRMREDGYGLEVLDPERRQRYRLYALTDGGWIRISASNRVDAPASALRWLRLQQKQESMPFLAHANSLYDPLAVRAELAGRDVPAPSVGEAPLVKARIVRPTDPAERRFELRATATSAHGIRWFEVERDGAVLARAELDRATTYADQRTRAELVFTIESLPNQVRDIELTVRALDSRGTLSPPRYLKWHAR